MKRVFRIRMSKMALMTSIIVISGLCGFAGVAISAESEIPSETNTVSTKTNASEQEISNGSPIQIADGVIVTPIQGWQIERKAMGMSLVMKEVLPQEKNAQPDYSKPIFARNITVLGLNGARHIDADAISEVKAEISKMISRDPSLKDFTFTDARLFDYKAKNDGIVLFSQLTVNNFQMMQMQILVSGESKAYLLTYSDLAASFSNPSTFEAAWKSMTSISVPGTAPKRFEKELILGSLVGGSLLAILLPFYLIRWRHSRKMRKLADELQYDWDHGALKSDADYELSEIRSLEVTRQIKQRMPGKKITGSSQNAYAHQTDLTSKRASYLSSVDSFSTRHSRFGSQYNWRAR